MAVCWKFLMPLSFINLAAVALEVYFLRDANGILTTADLWIMAAINIVLAVVSIAFFGSLIKEKVRSGSGSMGSANPLAGGLPTAGAR